MKLFSGLGNDLDYTECLELDGLFSVCHINYGKSPIFSGKDSRDLCISSRVNSMSSKNHVDDVRGVLCSFDGTENNYDEADRTEIWKAYWEEYINAFDKLVLSLPDSVVTAYIGRHAIELGFKYLLLKKTNEIVITHDLKDLSDKFYEEFEVTESYMENVNDFCVLYSKYIEGSRIEYFRYPEYKNDSFFAGNRLDIGWLSYNMALVILKLIHFDEMLQENSDDKT